MLGLSDIFSHCAASHSFAHTAYVTTVPLAVLACLSFDSGGQDATHREKQTVSTLISTAAAVLCRICVICLQEIYIIYYIDITDISSLEMHYHSCEPEQAWLINTCHNDPSLDCVVVLVLALLLLFPLCVSSLSHCVVFCILFVFFSPLICLI